MSEFKEYSLVNDLGFVKTGVKNFENTKKYYSTGSIKGKKFIEEGKYNFKNRPSRANREVKKDDVLQARMMNTNKVLLVDKKLDGSLFSTGFFQFRPPKELILPKYLYYYLTSKKFLEKKDSLSGGATQKAINDTNLKQIKILLPNLTKQEIIVSKIDKIFAEIDKAYDTNIKLEESIKAIQKTLLKLLLSKENKIKKIKLDSICTIKGRIGYRGYTKKDITTKGNGAISLSPSNIDNNKIVLAKNTYVTWEKYDESPEIMIFPKDIIFCKTGSTYGKTAYIEELPEKATLNPQLVVIKKILCNNKFLYYSMLSDNFKFQIEKIVGGAAVPTLSQKDLAQTEILLPPENIQKNIVHKIDKITQYSEEIFDIINSKNKKIISLKDKLLQKEIN